MKINKVQNWGDSQVVLVTKQFNEGDKVIVLPLELYDSLIRGK